MTELPAHAPARAATRWSSGCGGPKCDWDAALCDWTRRCEHWNASADVVEQVVLEAKYAGYIDRQAAQVERFQRLEVAGRSRRTSTIAAVPQLRAEAKEKLGRIRPASLGQASRISGISPADLAVLLIYLE